MAGMCRAARIVPDLRVEGDYGRRPHLVVRLMRRVRAQTASNDEPFIDVDVADVVVNVPARPHAAVQVRVAIVSRPSVDGSIRSLGVVLPEIRRFHHLGCCTIDE